MPVEIPEDMKRKIVDECVENATLGAKLWVSNPMNRTEKRTGLRLRIPAIHVMLGCDFVRTNRNPNGSISMTFSKYRPY